MSISVLHAPSPRGHGTLHDVQESTGTESHLRNRFHRPTLRHSARLIPLQTSHGATCRMEGCQISISCKYYAYMTCTDRTKSQITETACSMSWDKLQALDFIHTGVTLDRCTACASCVPASGCPVRDTGAVVVAISSDDSLPQSLQPSSALYMWIMAM